MKNTKYIIVIIVLLLMIFTVLGIMKNKQKAKDSSPISSGSGEQQEVIAQEAIIPEKEVFRIGIIVPLSGDLAFMGKGVQQAIDLVFLNNPDTKHTYEVFFEDSKMDAEASKIASQKLISENNVDFLVSLTSTVGNAVSDIAEENRIIHFAMASDPKIAEGPYNFIHWTTPNSQVEKLIEEIQRRQYTQVAILELDQTGWRSITDSLRKKLINTEIEIVSQEDFSPGVIDFKDMILRTVQDTPEIYLLATFSPELENIVKQMQELGIETPITSIESFSATDELSLFEGKWYVDSAAPNDTFTQQYQDTYNEYYTSGGPNAYDIAHMIVQVSETLEGFNINRFVEGLNTHINNNQQSIFGTLDISREGIIDSEASVMTIIKGEPRPLIQ